MPSVLPTPGTVPLRQGPVRGTGQTRYGGLDPKELWNDFAERGSLALEASPEMDHGEGMSHTRECH